MVAANGPKCLDWMPDCAWLGRCISCGLVNFSKSQRQTLFYFFAFSAFLDGKKSLEWARLLLATIIDPLPWRNPTSMTADQSPTVQDRWMPETFILVRREYYHPSRISWMLDPARKVSFLRFLSHSRVFCASLAKDKDPCLECLQTSLWDSTRTIELIDLGTIFSPRDWDYYLHIWYNEPHRRDHDPGSATRGLASKCFQKSFLVTARNPCGGYPEGGGKEKKKAGELQLLDGLTDAQSMWHADLSGFVLRDRNVSDRFILSPLGSNIFI